MNDEQWRMNDEQWWMNDERWQQTMNNGERMTTDGDERRTMASTSTSEASNSSLPTLLAKPKALSPVWAHFGFGFCIVCCLASVLTATTSVQWWAELWVSVQDGRGLGTRLTIYRYTAVLWWISILVLYFLYRPALLYSQIPSPHALGFRVQG